MLYKVDPVWNRFLSLAYFWPNVGNYLATFSCSTGSLYFEECGRGFDLNKSFQEKDILHLHCLKYNPISLEDI